MTLQAIFLNSKINRHINVSLCASDWVISLSVKFIKFIKFQSLLRMKAKVQRIIHGRLGSEMRIVSITFAMFATIFFFLATGGRADPTCHRSGNPKDWDLLKLEQTWPPAFCNLSYRDNQQCIPKNVDYWVIHGLWPTKSGTRDPNCCNNSWPFHEKNVQGLRPALDNYWPDFNPRHIGPNISWRHEWEEHGTCGTILPSLRDELHYFNYTLQSYYRFNLAKIFEQQGVTPSNSPYKTQTLKDIVHKAVGAEPEFLCVKGRRTKYILLEHIVICMNKSGQVVDCPVSQLRSGQGQHDGWKGRYEDGHDRSLRFYSEINSENLHQNPEWSGADIKCPMSGSIIYLPFP